LLGTVLLIGMFMNVVVRPSSRPVAVHTVAARTEPTVRPGDDPLSIGLAWLDSTGGCVNFPRRGVASGTVVTFVSVPVGGSTDSATILVGTVVAPAVARDRACTHLDPSDVGIDAFYTVRLAGAATRAEPRDASPLRGQPEWAGYRMALLAPPEAVTRRPASTTVVFPAGESPVALRACTGVETVHLTAWQGTPLTGRRLFHGAYSVGYDMVPSCIDTEVMRSGRAGPVDTSSVASPDGRWIAFVRPTPNTLVETTLGLEQATELWIARPDRSEARLFVRGGSADTMATRVLAVFHAPGFSPDGRQLYFISRAAVVTDAVHAVDIGTGIERFVALGNTLDVVGRGPYAGCLLVSQHESRPDGGSDDETWVLGADGRRVTPVGPDSGNWYARRAVWKRGDVPPTAPATPPDGACRAASPADASLGSMPTSPARELPARRHPF
jgi:hypothetical protein